MKLVILLVSICLSTVEVVVADASAVENSKQDIDPVYAADQAELTTEAIALELKQFDQIKVVNGNNASRHSLVLKMKYTEKQYYQYQRLYQRGSCSEEAFRTASLNYEMARLNIDRHDMVTDLGHSNISMQQLKIKAAGRSVDTRQQAAEVYSNILGKQLALLQKDLEIAQVEIGFYGFLVPEYQKFCTTRTMPLSKCEQTVLKRDLAKQKKQEIDAKIASFAAAYQGVRKITDRLGR